MDVTFFSEIQRQRALAVVSSSFQISDDVTKERERSEHSYFFPGIELSLTFMIFHKRNSLLIGIDTILLRSHQVKKSFGTSI